MKKILTVLICLLVGTLSLHAQKGVRPRKGGKAAGAGRMESEISRAVERDSHQKPKAREVLPQSRPGASSATRRTQGIGEAPSRISATTSHTTSRPSARSPLAEESSTKKASSKTHQEEAPNPLGTKERTSVTRETNFVSSAGRFEKLVTKKPDTPATISEAESQLAELEAQNRELLAEKQALAFDADYTHNNSVLLAPMLQMSGEGIVEGGYSVTVIKVGDEIFGVIATHVIPDLSHNRWGGGFLAKKFEVEAFNPLTKRKELFDAEVVATIPSSMADVSLVKFDADLEPLLNPREIAKEAPAEGENLRTIGYGAAKPVVIDRTVYGESNLSLRTDLDFSGDRQGLCGSAVVNEANQIVGIHSGTRVGKDGSILTSYVAKFEYINLLIDAYHNDGKAIYNIELDGEILARLDVSEYIDGFHLYNAAGKLVAQKNIVHGTADEFPKFSESTLRNLLQNTPEATYLLLRSRTPRWSKGNLSFDDARSYKSKTSTKIIDPTKRENWYNLQTHEILPSRPEGITM